MERKKWSPPDFPENVYVVAIWEKINDEPEHWHIYLFNEREETLTNVLITCSGYGELNGEDVKTSLIRYSLGDISGYTAKRIEPINTDVLGLYNQYWVSFYIGRVIYDKRFIFPPSSITSEKKQKINALYTEGIFAE